MDIVHLNDNPVQCMIRLVQPSIVLSISSPIVRNLSISLNVVALRMIGNPLRESQL